MAVGQGRGGSRARAAPEQLIRWLALAGTAVVLLVIASSAYLRLTAAGLGCEDWPACYGRQATSTVVHATPARLVHRVSATLAGAVVLGIGIIALTQPRRFKRELKLTALLLLITLALATLGRATPGAGVPAVAMGNVLGGMLMSALLWWLALGHRTPGHPPPTWVTWMSWASLVLAFVQIGLGVLTSASYSGLACPGLPLCTSDGFPGAWSAAELDPWTTDTGRASAHMAHRVMGLAAAAAILALAFSHAIDRGIRAVLVTLLALQLLMGTLLVWLSLPLLVDVAHNLCAALLLLALVASHHGLSGKAAGLI